MWAVHSRMAELWHYTKSRDLTEEEQKELSVCLDAHLNKCRKLAALENLSLVASMTNDDEWQHEICNQIEEVYAELF